MPVTVKVNGTANSLVHKGSNGVSAATMPDVCKTPSPGGPVPLPYPNVSQSATLAKGTTTVKADGGMMIAIKGSEFSLSNGDNAGTLGGVKSSTFMKESTWISYSFDVKMEGKNACRLTDKKFQNHGNTVDLAGVFQGPAAVVDAIGQETANQICTSICEAREKQRRGEIPSKEYPTLQSYVAKQHSSGFPLYSPTNSALLVEATWKLPARAGGAFTPVLSSTGRMLGSGHAAPAGLMGGLAAGRGAPGTTFRPDFTMLKDANQPITWNNTQSFVEVKFEGDELSQNQRAAKTRAPKKRFQEIHEADCKCS